MDTVQIKEQNVAILNTFLDNLLNSLSKIGRTKAKAATQNSLVLIL